jgi:hypothetical protein
MTATAAMIGTVHDESRIGAAGMTDGAVRTWLRLEGFAGFATGVALFGLSGGSWLLLVPLLLLPDISTAGYLVGPRVGAFTYNLLHTWTPGLVVLGLSALVGSPILQIAAGILIAHVGMDRAVGYGLKLPSSFHDTHLGRMGRSKA